mgnify:CR=1 FL=1
MNWAQILKFCINNWKELLVVFSLCLVALKSRMDYNSLRNAYEISIQENEERITALQAIHSEEIARREQAIDTYKSAMYELRKRYDQSQSELREERRAKTELYERQFTQNKGALADEIIGTFNFEHVE